MRKLLLIAIVVAGCKKQVPPPPPPPEEPEPVEEPAIDSQEEAVEEIMRNFSRVHFDYDSAQLTDDSMAALKANAAVLQDFNDILVEVQGHADERGTIEYNLALGQRRAHTIKEYLVRMGVSGSRIHVLSYGEERPADAGHGANAWSANRRAEFRIMSGAPSGVSGSVE